jgi:ribonuclease PH
LAAENMQVDGRAGREDQDLDAVVDPTAEERHQCVACTTLALMPNLNRVTSMVQVGPVPGHKAIEAMEICTEGCTDIHAMMRNCLLADFAKRQAPTDAGTGGGA